MKKVEVAEEAITGVNIVPIIDVTLVLLVILLLMSPVLNIPSVFVDLPDAMTKETKDQNLTVSLSKDGLVSIDSEVVPWDRFPSRLQYALRGRKETMVIVRADKGLPYGRVENFLRVVNKNVGKRGVAIATKQRSTKLEGMEK